MVMYGLSAKIEEWNRNVLELFRISEPNENREFFGVVRFYFHGPNEKYHSKCVRISSQATARHLVNVLVEKFHPDLRLLKSGRYAIYEYHPSTGERRLGAEERPLVNQINWRSNQREGRFILRDESKFNTKGLSPPPPLPASTSGSSSSLNLAKWRSAGNLMTEVPSLEALARNNEPLATSTDELVFAIPNDKRAKASSGTAQKKKKAKSLKTAGGDKKKSKSTVLSDDEQTVMRTASLPNVFDEAGGLGAAARDSVDSHAGSLTVFLQSANLPDPSKTLKCTIFETAEQIIRRLLAFYGRLINVESYCLEQVSIPPKKEGLPQGVRPRRFLRPEERPLHILRAVQAQFPRIRAEFHLTQRPHEQQDYVNISVKTPTPQLVEVNPNGTPKPGRVLRFNLTGLVQHEGDGRQSGSPIKVGSVATAVGPPPNILLSANRFPDIRPVHCTLLPASSAADGGNGAGAGAGASVLISPALDVSTRPPGPTAVYLDGRKVVRPSPLRHGCIVQLGLSLFLKFLEQGASLEKTKSAQPHISKGSMPDLTFQGEYAGRGREKQYRSRPPSNQPTYANTDHLFPNRLPIWVDLRLSPSAATATTDDYAASLHEAACDAVDAVLRMAAGLAFQATTAAAGNARSSSRPPIFVLTPAFLLYGLVRGCHRRWNVAQMTYEQREHYLSGLFNHIGSQMFQCIQTCRQTDSRKGPSTRATFSRLLFWLANSSELLNFLRNDVDCSESMTASGHLFTNCIESAFHQLLQSFLDLVKRLAPSILFPGDYDQQDDLHLDDKPLLSAEDANVFASSTSQEPDIQRLLQSLAFMMRAMRQACVNVSFALQFFAYVFHALGGWTFNAIVQTNGRQEGRRREGGAMWTTRMGAGRLLRRLQRMQQWAGRHGLGSVCEVHLLLPVQACQLVMADRAKFRSFHKRVLELRSLNSAKVEWLLTHLGDPPAMPSEWIKNIVKSVRNEVDREILEKHGSPSSRETREMLGLQTSVELALPLIVPLEGYAATSGLSGIPEGFFETVQPLVEDGCLSVRRNESALEPPLNGLWTGHFASRLDPPPGQGGRQTNKASANLPDANVERLAKEAGVKLSTVKRIVLQKNGQPLGLGIVAAKPEGNALYGIYIRHIVPDSVADRDGRLEVGDQLLAIANSSLVNCDQSEAAVAILGRISNAVHLVVGKRAAQGRGIMGLINSAQSGRPLPPPSITRSTPCLVQSPQLKQGSDGDDDDDDSNGDDDDEDDDGDDMNGAQFGSRSSFATASRQRQSQPPICRPKSMDGLSTNRGMMHSPEMNEFEESSGDLSSDEGSDEVWQPAEQAAKPGVKCGERPLPPNGPRSFQLSPPTALAANGALDDGSNSVEWNEYAKKNAEVLKQRDDASNVQQISPTLSSLSSSSSIITQEKPKDPPHASQPQQEGVYNTASEVTSESEDILTKAEQRIASASASASTAVNRVVTAEKMTSPLNTAAAKGLTDRAMQTVAECAADSRAPVVDSTKSSLVVALQASAVQTDPLQAGEEARDEARYSPPLDRLPLAKPPPRAGQAVSRPTPRHTATVRVEDVTKVPVDPQLGRFQQQAQPLTHDLVTSSSSYTAVSTRPRTGEAEAEASTIQSGIAYWSSQNDLAIRTASPPPEPTADFPQYHPPACLEPSDLAIKFGDVDAARRETSPSKAPTPPSLSVYGPPASHFIPRRPSSRESSPLRVDLIHHSRSLSASNHALRTSSLSHAVRPEVNGNESRNLHNLVREIRRLEDVVSANPNEDLIRELDQLRAEYRFQLQMDERSRTRSLNAHCVSAPDKTFISKIGVPVLPQARFFRSNETLGNGCVTSQPLDDFTSERLEAIRVQEQKSRIYEEALKPKHDPDPNLSTSLGFPLSSPTTTVPPMQPRFTYQVDSGPLYGDRGSPIIRARKTPNYAQTSHNTLTNPSAIIESNGSPLSRNSELRASRKSVSFDPHLESVALYSPTHIQPVMTSRPLDQVRRGGIRGENQPSSRNNQSTAGDWRDSSIRNHDRDSHPLQNVTQPENAENLSFKDKMAFFAKAIGEEIPKDRFKASYKEREIMNSLAR